MKNQTQNPKTKTGLKNRTEQVSTARRSVETAIAEFSTPNGGDVTARDEAERAQRQDNRLPIDMNRRRVNRCLKTQQVIDLLQKEAPSFFAVAEVIGKWVWVQFSEKQSREITAQLAQLGFHWNNKRQAWQHPCGIFRKDPASYDPRTRYGSHFPADSVAA
jgi:hypothetical protein